MYFSNILLSIVNINVNNEDTILKHYVNKFVVYFARTIRKSCNINNYISCKKLFYKCYRKFGVEIRLREYKSHIDGNHFR